MFETLSGDEKQLLVRFPYRVGLYVSEADQDGGEAAQDRERRVLSSILNGFALDVMGAESIQHVISVTIDLQDEWDQWGEGLEYMPAECDQMIELVSQHISDKDARAFAVQMYEIAEAVALAFREYEEGGFFDRMALKWRYLKDQKLARKHGLRQQNLENYKYISASEREALHGLARGLGLIG